MQGFVQGADRQQTTLLPECFDDWIDEGNSVRAVDVFVDALELRALGFDGVDPAATGRPAKLRRCAFEKAFLEMWTCNPLVVSFV
jgi:transposase